MIYNKENTNNPRVFFDHVEVYDVLQVDTDTGEVEQYALDKEGKLIINEAADTAVTKKSTFKAFKVSPKDFPTRIDCVGALYVAL